MRSSLNQYKNFIHKQIEIILNLIPESAQCFANNDIIGEVVINDPKNSITRETLDEWNTDNSIGVGITNITSATGLAHTITTVIDHGLNRITAVSIANSGAGYGTGTGGDIYNARLVSIGSSITGKNASVKLTVDNAGGITAVKVMDGGSAYGIGKHYECCWCRNHNWILTSSITSNSEYMIMLVMLLESMELHLSLLRDIMICTEITGIGTVGVGTDNERTINVASASTITGFTTAGVAAECTNAFLYETGDSIPLSSISYDFNSGIATVVSTRAHGLAADKKIRIAGVAQTQYNGSFVITNNINQTSFAVNMGTGTTNPTASGTMFALPEGICFK